MMSYYVWILMSCIGFLMPMAVSASDYYQQHAIGWHWYDDPREEKHLEKPAPDPVVQMNAIQQALKQALDRAILNPTPQHVRDYIALQNQVSDRASRFARMWQFVLLQHPTLDYAIAHPTNQLGRNVYLDQQRLKEDAAIHQLAQHSGLFFFYRGSCPYCQRFAPIVKDFSQRYGMPVIPITTDGVVLPPFPNSKLNKGQAEKFRVTVVPALFAVNPHTHQAMPVSYGLITEDALRRRLLDIATNFQGHDE